MSIFVGTLYYIKYFFWAAIENDPGGKKFIFGLAMFFGTSFASLHLTTLDMATEIN